MGVGSGGVNGRGFCRSKRERLQVVFRDGDYVSSPRGLCRSARSIIVGVGSLDMRVYRVDRIYGKKVCLYCAALRGGV